MRDSAREHPASFGDSWMFRTTDSEHWYGRQEWDLGGELSESKGEIGALSLLGLGVTTKYPSSNIQKVGGDERLRLWKVAKLGT